MPVDQSVVNEKKTEEFMTSMVIGGISGKTPLISSVSSKVPRTTGVTNSVVISGISGSTPVISSVSSTVDTYDKKTEFSSSYATTTNETSSGTKLVTSVESATSSESGLSYGARMKKTFWSKTATTTKSTTEIESECESGIGVSESGSVLSDWSVSSDGIDVHEFIRQMMKPSPPVAVEPVDGSESKIEFVYVNKSGKVEKTCDSSKATGGGGCDDGKKSFS